MRAPDFWWRERPTAAALALAPLAAAYGAAAARRLGGAGTAVPAPVICVGNFVVGGAGKTPTALALAAWLVAQGRDVAFLSRGYGGSARGRRGATGVLRVDPARHGPDEVGDEPLLLARAAPCYVAADRVAAARAAVRDGADVVVMDDGLQNPGLAKDLRIVVVDGGAGFGNRLCLPAGPLRAPLARQWPGVDVAVVIGDGAPGDAAAREAEDRGVPALRARLEPDARALRRLAGRRLVAFSGIGRPGKFFRTLAESGLDVVRTLPFPDHHPFSARDRAGLLAAARAAEATLVTTEKDRVRLPADFPAEAMPVTLGLDDPDALERLLAERLSRRA